MSIENRKIPHRLLTLLRSVVAHATEPGEEGYQGAPTHGHDVPGKWDGDAEHPKGSECLECKDWGELRRLAASGSTDELYATQLAADAAFAAAYPNLAKESQVKERASEIFTFLEHLAERGINLAQYGEGDHLVWASTPTGKGGFIDEFYGLDRKATEAERERLLESVRGAQ